MNERRKQYLVEYYKKFKEIRFRVKDEEYKAYEEAAKKAGYPSMRQFYLEAINEKMEKLQKEAMGSKDENMVP